MDKLIVGIIFVCFSTFCGYLLSKKYRRRKKFFQQWTIFNERFLNEIAYYRRPLKEFYQKFEYDGDFNLFLLGFLESLTKNEGNKWEFEGLLKEFSFLEKEDKGMITDYFLMLGRGDSRSQKEYFSSVKSPLEKRALAVETQAKKYGDLYVKLGFLLGLALLIIIV